MKILVAGSTGYLGSHIVQELMDRKIEFKLNAMAMDMTTNQYGNHTIKEFFTQLKTEEILGNQGWL